MINTIIKYKGILIFGLFAFLSSSSFYGQIFRGGSGDGFGIDSISCHTTVIILGTPPYVGGSNSGFGKDTTMCSPLFISPYFGGERAGQDIDETTCTNLDLGIYIGGEGGGQDLAETTCISTIAQVYVGGEGGGQDLAEITCISTIAQIYTGGSNSGSDIAETQCVTIASVLYVGGQNGGQNFENVDCNEPLSPPYLGGNNDGMGVDSITCITTVITGDLPYVGGSGDGFGKTEESCPISVITTYVGGSGDGFGKTEESCPISVTTTTYVGGSQSGFNFDETECPPPFTLPYLGGIEIGVALDEQICPPVFSPHYLGGINGGQHCEEMECPPLFSPLYIGGPFDGFSMDSDGYPCPTENTPLPVTLYQFNANPVYTDGDVDVFCSWTTVSEANTNYFIIEKTKTFDQWDYVGNVSATGFSNFTIDYDLTDFTPYDGISFYRLTSVDYDGTEEVFAPEKVNIGPQGNDILEIFPNPSNGIVNINVELNQEDEGELIITDLRGRTIQVESYYFDSALGTITMDLSPYPKGVYMISVKTSHSFITKRLIKQ